MLKILSASLQMNDADLKILNRKIVLKHLFKQFIFTRNMRKKFTIMCANLESVVLFMQIFE